MKSHLSPYFLVALVLELLVFTAGPARATAANSADSRDGEAISCGIYRRIHSTVLREDRVLLIHLPHDYATTNRKCPVLYKLDGERVVFLGTVGTVEYLADWVDPFPAPIVVAIENTDRNRDMLPGRGGDDFLRFLNEELAPFVEANYRTNGFRILCGQSLSSVFALYSFLKEPDAFDAYVLGSFGLSPEWLSLFESELGRSSVPGNGKKYLCVVNGKLDAYDPDGARAALGARFVESLRHSAASTLRFHSRVYDDEGHVPFPTIYHGLKWLYSPEAAGQP